MRLFALAGLLALSAAAHADLIPSQFGVAVSECCGYVASGGTVSGAAYLGAPYNPGFYLFIPSLTPTTATFQVGGSILGPGYGGNLPLSTVVFFGPQLTKPITGFTLDPSSTIKGIVPSTSIQSGSFYGQTLTDISFDFTNANVFPGGTATFDLTFASQASAPEIDPSLAASGLILVAGAIAVLRSRRSRPQATPCS